MLVNGRLFTLSCNKAQTCIICFNAASKIATAVVLLNKVSCATAPCNKSGGLHGSQWQEHQSLVRIPHGLLMDLVAIGVHGKLTAGSAPLSSDARFSSRHCKGAPENGHALPPPENGQYLHKIFDTLRHF
jgi:hypothetical protein